MNRSMRHKRMMYFGIFLCVALIALILIRQCVRSAFFSSEDRINILFYGEKPMYFSLERGGEIHYVTTFGADSRTDVPGGYGTYRLGALGKLSLLEKNPDLFRRTFSRITGSMLDFYFYPEKDTIYFGSQEEIALPSLSTLFFSSSNASFFDRLYLWSQFAGKRRAAFEQVVIKKIRENDEILLSDKTFQEQYLGYFYSKQLREENKTVQILYQHSYASALTVSRIIDGEGMRVVDRDTEKDSQTGGCLVTENTSSSFSLTTTQIAHFFGCRMASAKGSLSDIVVYLRDTERDWE